MGRGVGREKGAGRRKKPGEGKGRGWGGPGNDTPLSRNTSSSPIRVKKVGQRSWLFLPPRIPAPSHLDVREEGERLSALSWPSGCYTTGRAANVFI